MRDEFEDAHERASNAVRCLRAMEDLLMGLKDLHMVGPGNISALVSLLANQLDSAVADMWKTTRGAASQGVTS